MSDALLSTPVVLNRSDGSSREFKKCSPADRIAYRRIFRLYRKQWLVDSLRTLGITGEAALPHLNKLDGTHLRESHVADWLNDWDGQTEAILLSLRHDNPDATIEDVYALDLSDGEALKVAAGVFNVPLVPLKGGSESDRPLAGSGGTPTGAAAPTSSGTTAESPTH